jgi:hypothetical protein
MGMKAGKTLSMNWGGHKNASTKISILNNNKYRGLLQAGRLVVIKKNRRKNFEYQEWRWGSVAEPDRQYSTGYATLRARAQHSVLTNISLFTYHYLVAGTERVHFFF